VHDPAKKKSSLNNEIKMEMAVATLGKKKCGQRKPKSPAGQTTPEKNNGYPPAV
jgi:hypothetical protein